MMAPINLRCPFVITERLICNDIRQQVTELCSTLDSHALSSLGANSVGYKRFVFRCRRAAPELNIELLRRNPSQSTVKMPGLVYPFAGHVAHATAYRLQTNAHFRHTWRAILTLCIRSILLGNSVFMGMRTIVVLQRNKSSALPHHIFNLFEPT